MTPGKGIKTETVADINKIGFEATVLPAKSDSDFKFCLQNYQGLIIERLRVYLSYPPDRINTQVIYRFALTQVKCTR